MVGHMHEHGPSYTGVPFVMFDVGGWVRVVWCVVLCEPRGTTRERADEGEGVSEGEME